MDEALIEAYRGRCRRTARITGWYGASALVAGLLAQWLLALPVLNLRAIVILLLSRGVAQGHVGSQRWCLLFCILEVFIAAFLLVALRLLVGWEVPRFAELRVASPESVVLAALGAVLCAWAGVCCWRLARLLRDHPVRPAGLGTAAAFALVVALGLAVQPALVRDLRDDVYGAIREWRRTLIEADGERFLEQVWLVGPGGQQEVGVVLLVPTDRDDPAAVEVPEGARVRRGTAEEVILADDSRVPHGSLVVVDPATGVHRVVARDVTRERLVRGEGVAGLLEAAREAR